MGIYATRDEALREAQATLFDVCIIGGGASGAGCALDAALRGYRVLLIEKEDFAAATSSKSTKLVHGGVRYLEQAVKKANRHQYRMVEKALLERSTLLKLAPHLTRPIQLLTPCRTWVEGLYYYIGLKLYDFISRRRQLGKSELLSRQKALERIPTLKPGNLFTAVLYYDGQLDDQRFNLALVQTAQQKGATCFNHVQVEGFVKDNAGKITAVACRDTLMKHDYVFRATAVINATGPFADKLRLLANDALKPRIRVSRGVHIVLPKQMLPAHTALLIPKTHDGRLIFAIPYHKHLLVGTTDDPTQLTEDEFGPTASEVEYLLRYVNEYLDVQATPNDVLAGFGGLRPLIEGDSAATKDLVRDHEVEYDERSGLISLMGGKWTTYRLMAKDTIDELDKHNQKKTACSTASSVLVGSENFSRRSAIELLKISGWDHELVKHTISKYGVHAFTIHTLSLETPHKANRMLPGLPFTWVELHYVLTHEMAYTLEDVINRRWGVQLLNWQQAIDLISPVAAFMHQHFGWTDEQRHYEEANYKNVLDALIKTAKS